MVELLFSQRCRGAHRAPVIEICAKFRTCPFTAANKDVYKRQNLLSNAVRYNRVGGEIFLSARETARTEETVAYEFVVRDTGVGMSEAFQQRAFEPFAQEDASARSSLSLIHI